MDLQYNVIYTGELRPGIGREAFINAFCQRFKCDEAKAAAVADSRKPITMKNAVALAAAEEYKKVLEGLGMTIRIDPVNPAGSHATPETVSTSNPYQAPTAQLEKSPEFGEMTGPVSVPAGHGASWVSSAFSNHFKESPGAWIGAIVVFLLLSMIPLINLIMVFLMPVFVGGLMLGARAQDEGEGFQFNALFRGFSRNTGQLILLNVLLIIGTILIMIVSNVLIGGSVAMLGGIEPNGGTLPPATILLPMLVMLLLYLPLMMAYWFAPALIAIDNISALSAMKLSFVGCLKNIVPFLIYGILLLVLMFVAAIPLGLGLLVVIPVMYASMYTAYRDIYYPEA